MKRWIRNGLIAATCLFLLGAGFVGYAYRWMHTPLETSENTFIELRHGEPFTGFVARLHLEGIVDKPRILTWTARLLGQARRAQAGEYIIDKGATPAELLQQLVQGRVVSYTVQIIEGWTVMQAVDSLARNEVLESELLGVSEASLLAALGLPDGSAEGLFFPDTYRFVRGDSDADVLRRAYGKMRDELQQAWQTRVDGLPYQSAYEALVVASLIEKETGREEDRIHISQVFATRLHLSMYLQTDPTVIYGLGERYDGNLTRKHLREDTPYNTYVHKGLPPTPIALPGINSITAAMNPGAGVYLYFVAQGDGGSQFSVSLEDHLAAVRKYQLR
ncbi:MAG: endolytic transglycosylase MltG [Gammaproteobacteria bacterium]|nr:endolytic transglycosylase MltG [Gammaproteobacteria bacterium]